MKKILFLTPQLPFPPISGGVIKSFKLIEYLYNNYDVAIGCLLKNSDKHNIKDFLLKIPIKNYVFQEIDIPRNIFSLLKSFYYNKPLSIYRNYSVEFQQSIYKLIKENKFDILFVDHFLMFQYIPSNFRGKIILHQHNAEFVMWERAAIKESNPFKKVILLIEAKRVKNYEAKILNKSDYVLASPHDIKNLLKLGSFNRTKFYETLHLGDEQLLELPSIKFEETEKSLLFIGTLSWEANIDGLIWFLTHPWPKLKKIFKDLKFYIVGSNPPLRLLKIVNKLEDVIITGFVDNLENYYKKCRVFVSPLRFGSGIKVKNINAMYRGIPIVTTSVGIEGIYVKDMVHVAIANNEEEFIEKIILLIKNKNLWNKLSINSRILAKEKYTWDKPLRILRQVIDNV